MAVTRTGQLRLADAPVGCGGSGSRQRLDGLVDRGWFAALVGEVRADAGVGRASWPELVLVKALVLQSLYGLSDHETADAPADRLSFRRSCGLGLQEGVPDHSVICQFRNALVVAGLQGGLLAELDRQLEAAGVMVRRGTMLDATLVQATTARPKGGKAARDQDAGFARRQGRAGSVYGFKAHVGVDEGSGLVRSLIVTPAHVNDTGVADALPCCDARQVRADATHHTHAREAAPKARGVKPRLARRASKHHPLSARLKRCSRRIARRRAAVETTFATWKRRMGLTAIRHVGLARASAQRTLATFAVNLRRWAALTA